MLKVQKRPNPIILECCPLSVGRGAGHRRGLQGGSHMQTYRWDVWDAELEMGVLKWGVGFGRRWGCRVHIQDVNGQHSAGAGYPCSAQGAGLDWGADGGCGDKYGVQDGGCNVGCRERDAGVGKGCSCRIRGADVRWRSMVRCRWRAQAAGCRCRTSAGCRYGMRWGAKCNWRAQCPTGHRGAGGADAEFA